MRIRYTLLTCVLATLGAAELPKPAMSGGKPLMEALKARRTTREFAPRKLPDQILSNLLWAAFGINRPENDHRTAPSANNRQDVDLYVITADGAFLYEAKPHALKPVAEGDLRALTGSQAFVKEAPLEILLVADTAKLAKAASPDALINSAIGAGAIVQNIYLFCASEGLATVVRAGVNRAELEKALKLRPEQRIYVAQTIGFMK